VFAAGIASTGCAATPADKAGPRTARWHVLDDDGVPVARIDARHGDTNSTEKRSDAVLMPAHATSGSFPSTRYVVRFVFDVLGFIADVIRLLGCMR
jgi:hypothetical protein